MLYLQGNPCKDEIGVTGLCRANFPSFTFNHKVGKCEEFTYGGCGGSSNRFQTKKDCENECGERHTTLLVKFIDSLGSILVRSVCPDISNACSDTYGRETLNLITIEIHRLDQ